MSSKSDSRSSINDERLGPFGQAAISMLDALFPKMYHPIVVAHPSFSDSLRANISPQFERGEFYAVSVVEQPQSSGSFVNDISRFDSSQDAEELLNHYRYEHAIFASKDLGIVTAWAQAEYAIIAFKKALVSDYESWFEAMRELDVLYEIG